MRLDLRLQQAQSRRELLRLERAAAQLRAAASSRRPARAGRKT